MEVDILVRLGIQESFYEAGDDDAAKHSELDDVNTSFAASGHLQFVDAGINYTMVQKENKVNQANQVLRVLLLMIM